MIFYFIIELPYTEKYQPYISTYTRLDRREMNESIDEENSILNIYPTKRCLFNQCGSSFNVFL